MNEHDLFQISDLGYGYGDASSPLSMHALLGPPSNVGCVTSLI